MKDVVVIDIETKNTFADVGGEEHIGDLEVSVACVYSYNEAKFKSFWEPNMAELGRLLQDSGLVVGFSINRFDLPVLDRYFPFSTKALKRLDILEEIEANFGSRIGLDILAQTNIGAGKTHHSLEAIRLWNEGQHKELENYCLNDVKITKDLYELAREQGHLLIPDRKSGEIAKVSLDFSGILRDLASAPNTLF
ncbi:MAG: helicase [Patescibacteria group bacterium]|nr:helicase [Patescibacteria group bacterium]MCL5261687.1 helicase [Patescibacteria group bacterium]